MFQSAVLKLTAWYAGILMMISILFSIAIFQISLSEVNDRITHFQYLVETRTSGESTIIDPSGRLLNSENREAARTLFIRLVYINLVVLTLGSLASYFLARRTLRPVQEAHEAQARFVTDTSHELRTPLAIMKSELEVSLRDKELTTQELRAILQSNLEEVNHLTRMSETLLALAHLESKPMGKQTVDLKNLAEEAILRFKLPPRRLSLKAKTARVLGNETALVELLCVLIDNALKYSPRTSRVDVTVATRKNTATVSVKNEGVGIEPGAMVHLFERFYRADSSRTGGTQKGFGLGLSIAKQIAELHDGEITVTSGKNDLTVFTYSQPKVG